MEAKNQYRVTYADRRTHVIPADSFVIDAGIVNFYQGGELVFAVPVANVESVGLAEFPEPGKRGPAVG